MAEQYALPPGFTSTPPASSGGSTDEQYALPPGFTSTPPAAAPPDPDAGKTPLVQGAGAVDKGVAAVLGSPVDLVNFIMGGGANAINAATGSDIHPAAEPFLGSKSIGDMMTGVGQAATAGPVGQAADRIVSNAGQSVADAVSLPGQVLSGSAGQPTVDSATGAVNQFPDDMIARGANAAGLMLGGESLPGAGPKTLATGGAFGFDRPGVVGADGTPVPVKVARAVTRDGVPVDQVQSQVAQLGPAGTVADLGDNTQKLAAGVASQPGAAGATVTNAMRARAADATNRVPSAINDTLGPATPPSQLQAEIAANKKAVGPLYDKVLATAAPVDTSELAQSIDAEIPGLRGKAQSDLRTVRGMLNAQGGAATTPLPSQMSAKEFSAALQAAGGDVTKVGSVLAQPKLDTNASTLFATRNAIDGMLSSETDSNALRVLKAARAQVDGLLMDAAPGIKDVDAQYRELSRQSGAVEQGGAVLDGGKSATWPQENAAAVAEGVQPQGTLVGPSATTFRLSQGARADIERIVGTKTNDRVALANIMQGSSDWNPQKLAQLFGADRAARIMQVVDNERQMANTENLAVNGSKTAAVQAAQNDVNARVNGPSALRAGFNGRFGDFLWGLADKASAGHASAVRAAEHQQLADALLGNGDWRAIPATAPAQLPLPIPARQNNQQPTRDDVLAAVMRGP